jgi:K+:H+ antiporter subunit KhtT
MEIVETLLPGVGIRYELVTKAGRDLVVIIRRDGDVQLCTYGRDDPDEATERLELQADEALAIADLLGAARVTQRFADLSREVPGLESARLAIAPGSPYDGRRLGDTKARTRTSCSIVAVVRGDDVSPAPGPEHPLRAGDVLVVIGGTSGLEQLAALLEDGWTPEVQALGPVS